MTDLLLDNSTKDLVIDDGDLTLIPTLEQEALQAVTTTLNTFRGEWFMNISYGVPWLANENNPIQLLGSKDKVEFDSFVRQSITSNPEIVSIITYDSLLYTNAAQMQISATLETEVGPITITNIELGAV